MPWLPLERPAFLGLVLLMLAGAAGVGAWYWRDSSQAEARAMTLTGGDPARGRALLRPHGCTGCHSIPGVRGANGRAGPALQGFAGRLYIGGVAENSAANLIRWLEDPPSLAPHTAMPRTGLSPQEARDVAALLYTLR